MIYVGLIAYMIFVIVFFAISACALYGDIITIC